jgi:thiol-disulfide isomerase/thioredoxin
MPSVRLACFRGGGRIAMSDLRGPALVNLWASWCGPCRTELPALQQYATRAAGAVSVIGVITRDRGRAAPAAVVEDLGLTFPMLADADGALLTAIGRGALPVTLAVAADGRIAGVHAGPAMDGPAVDALVDRYLGVAVPR